MAKDFEPYTQMATYYDLIYHKLVDYEAECDFLGRLFKRHSNHKVRKILDIGCGTGNHSVILADRGYQVVGIDQSEAMLAVARRKTSQMQGNILFANMDMRKITVKERKFDAALILFGGFTYLLRDPEIENCFRSIREHLGDRGLLIFEFWQGSGILPAASTASGYKPWDRIEDRKMGRLLLRLSTSRYDPLTNFMTIIFDHYVINTKNETLVDQFQETHVMRTFDVTEVKRLLARCGLDPIAFYAKGLDNPPKVPTISTSRIICVATPRSR